MSDDIVIKVENLTKIYKLYDSPLDRLKESLHPMRKKYHHDFYALKDVNFEVKKGETVGIIGRNGSGKSTLLKIITGVLTPSYGTVMVKGKISALLELGAGFNPELTGIENVYFNGTLMGFDREVMEAKLDSIISFADIGEFIHQPIKTYSSGMLVRLAFAVQSMVDPDVLIVDEALAVGDAFFQKRCFQKLEQLISNGTTLLFVSHDQESIRTLTTRAVLLKDGIQHKTGLSSDVVLEYRRILHDEETTYYRHEIDMAKQRSSPSPQNQNVGQDVQLRSEAFSFGDGDAEILEVKVFDGEDNEATLFYPGELMRIVVTCKTHKNMKHLNVGIRIRNKEGIKMYSWGTLNQDIAIWAGRTTGDVFWDRQFKSGEIISVTMDCYCSLGANFYEIQASISEENDKYYGSQRMLHWMDEAAFFQVDLATREYHFGGVCDMKMKALL